VIVLGPAVGVAVSSPVGCDWRLPPRDGDYASTGDAGKEQQCHGKHQDGAGGGERVESSGGNRGETEAPNEAAMGRWGIPRGRFSRDVFEGRLVGFGGSEAQSVGSRLKRVGSPLVIRGPFEGWR
jgi:hypothetical protein